LSELEEYFATLIAYQATQRGDANPAISSVPLETLNDKDFNKKMLAIQAPTEATEKQDRDGTSTIAETDEDVTDPRQLYQKFNNLMQQNKIEIQYNKAMVNMAQGKEQEP
jgi:hypothetical protein